jgi:jmjN domain
MLCAMQSRKKRVRTKTSRFEFDSLDNDEQRMIQQAIRNSKKEFKRVEHAELIIPECPTYYPTIEEFKNPFGYISK